ncbi:hypothetical protein JD844_001034 [Phrynosoma platyrhinos]|uniref:Ig-like domain-containing protein n=1 Tax=Phrynosoma platyrhinos TaxID=52577 RepID=A0ABQ7T961_PHRPL|nr:hypothetical protein JD844_001034 [Phrynosoma platyrhinos]
MVTVSSASPSAPTLFPLIPPSGSFPDSGPVTIGCLAKDFLPDSIAFSWNNQNNVSLDASSFKRFPSIWGTSGTFMASSQASVSVNDWRNRYPFYCKADHEIGNKVIRVIAYKPAYCPNKMAVRAPPIKAFSSSYLNATITCDAVELSKQQTTLRWLRNGEPWDSGVTTTKPVLNSQSNCYSMRSNLVVTRRDWLADVKFSCYVQNADSDNILNISKNDDCPNTGPQVDTIAPTYADIYQTSSAKLICRISNIPYDQDLSELNVTWTQGSNHKTLETVFDQPIDQENGMQSIDATATICAADWKSGQTFICKVSFPGLLPKPVEKRLKKENGGTLYPPSVYVLPPPSDQLALRELATLTCLVKGFYPRDIFVQWLHNNRPVSALQYFTSQPSQESKQPEKYFVYSMLNINEQDWSAGDTYTCVVGHETLPYNTTQKTVDKNTEESDPHVLSKAYLDGIVDTEDDEELQNISSILSTFIILFLVSLFYSATVTVIKNGKASYSTSKITVPFSEFSAKSYRCRVNRGTDSQVDSPSAVISYKDCIWENPKPVQVYILTPNCGVQESSLELVCLLRSLGPGKASVEWLRNGEVVPKRVEVELTADEDQGSYSSFVRWNISKQSWDKGDFYTCKVTRPPNSQNITMYNTSKCQDTIKPSVAISQASLDISLKSAMALILICDVSGFSPKELSISWKKNDIPMNEKLYDNAMATATGDVYTTYSILKIGRDEAGGKGGSYSCVVHHSSTDEPITATENIPIDLFEPKAPTVELLQSIDRKKKTMVLKCIASNYRPKKLSILWKGGPQNKSETFVEQNMANGTYWASSQFKIPLSQWQDVESNTCEVVHKETNSTVVKKTSRKGLGNKSSITLLCSIHGFSPEKIQVTWEVGGKAQQVPKLEIYQQNGNRFYTGSNLTVPLKEWNKLHEYTCKVTQAEANNIQTAKISKCTACKDSIPPPSLYLLKPPLEMLVTQKKALLTCLVVGYELDHAVLTWMVNDLNHTKDARTGNIKSHTNYTQSLESHLNITSQVWDSGSKIQCMISHPCALFPDMNSNIKKCKDSNHIKEPSLSLVIPSATQLTQPTNQAVAWLACMISGFSPAEILVRWKKKNSTIDTSEYITGPPVAEAQSPTFTTQSILKVPASEWESRALYTCMVGHESLTGWKNISRNLYDFLEPASPQVMAFHTSEDREGQKLVCFASNFYPKNIDIQWHVKGHHRNCSSDASSLVLLANGRFQKSCHLVLSEEEWRMSEIYTCTVNHSSTTTLIKKNLYSSGMASTLSNETAIKMQLPSFEELFKNKSAALSCMAPHKNTTTNATFTWAMDGDPVNTNTTTTKDLKEANSTSWIYGQLWVNLTEWRDTTEFTCSIPGGLTETKSRWNGTLKPPKVYLQHQSSSEDLNTTLLCMAKDFYPGEIFLEWKEENKEMTLKGYDVHGLKYSWDCAIMGAALCDVRNENEDEYSELEEANSVWNKVSTFMVLFVVALFYGGLVTFIKVK